MQSKLNFDQSQGRLNSKNLEIIEQIFFYFLAKFLEYYDPCAKVYFKEDPAPAATLKPATDFLAETKS